MNAPKLSRMTDDLPSDAQIRQVLLDAISHKYGRGGVKAFAEDEGFPYDRVRDHLMKESKWTVQAMLAYMDALNMTFADLVKRTDAIGPGEGLES